MRIKKYLLLILALIQLFGFFAVPTAQAACSYTVSRFDPQGKTAALSSETLTFEVEVQASNLQCTTSETSTAILMLLDVKTQSGYQTLKTSTLKYTGTLAKTQITYSLSGLNTSSLNRENTAVFGLWVNVSGNNVSKSSSWTVNLTGNTSQTGNVPATVTFFAVNGSQKTQKSIFTANDQIEIVFNMSAQTVQFGVPQTSPNLQLRYNINNKYNDTLNVSRTDLSKNPSTQLIVSSEFGFQNSNTIIVSLHDRDNGTKITEVRSTVSATGFDPKGNPQDTGKDNPTDTGKGNPTDTPTTGSTSFDCKNNFDPKKCIYNPLPEDELTNMFLFIAKGFLIITAIWGVMFIIIGGFRMVMAAGNEEDYIAAKKTITWAILGVVITMLSFSIIAIVQNILSVDVIDTVNEQQK